MTAAADPGQSAPASAAPIHYVVMTGARDWGEAERPRVEAYFAKLAAAGPFVLIEGECRGADLLARRAAEKLGMRVEPVAADWKRLGRAAGPARNRKMIETLSRKRSEGHPTTVVYFHDCLEKSRGTKGTVALARKAGFAPVDGAAAARRG
ncbi:MAG TPA: SLOG family protein [Elusimicrobiota bacterium]|jgi:hypothetical protein|nr:SLOG family protein [Elusimicrobiota bacterium]